MLNVGFTTLIRARPSGLPNYRDFETVITVSSISRSKMETTSGLPPQISLKNAFSVKKPQSASFGPMINEIETVTKQHVLMNLLFDQNRYVICPIIYAPYYMSHTTCYKWYDILRQSLVCQSTPLQWLSKKDSYLKAFGHSFKNSRPPGISKAFR